MAVNKNFVVKNGLEVNTNLILADAATDKVGIGTTVPGYTLDVAGGIGATSVYAAGFSTFIGDVKIGSAQTTLTSIGNSVGVGTDAPSFLLDVRSAVSTGSTSLYVKGDARITGNLDVTGDISYDEVTGRNLYITGLSTFVGLSSAQDVRVGAALSVVGVSTFHGNIDANGHTDLTTVTVSGASTFTGAIDANSSLDLAGALDVHGHSEIDDINVSGASTFVGAANFKGNVDLGDATSDTITPTGRFDAALVPASDGAIDLGTSSLEWKDVYVDGHTELDDLNVSGVSTFAGTIDANGALDVDGHTELDDVNVSGASTFAGAADFNGAVDIDGHTELDDVNVSGMATFGSANIVAAGGTFQVGAGGTVLYVDTDGTLTIGSASTIATVSLNGGSIPSIGLVIALGG